MEDTVKMTGCSKSECEVAQTGSCAEGHDPFESCPFFGQELKFDDGIDNSNDTDWESEQELVNQNFIKLPSGEALDVAEIDEFFRRRPIRLITIVGEQDSGKTTLICSIYDRFLHGPFAGYLFAGSQSLIGLDRRHFYSRIESEQAKASTPRTSYSDGIHFFHFAVVSEDEQFARTDLMLSDRAGEKYRQARNNSNVVTDLIEVVKANRLVLLLDGDRVANPAERANAIASVRHTLRAFLDGGILNRKSYVQIVTTKFDRIKVLSIPEQEKINTFLDEFKNRLLNNFQNRVGKLSFFEIAARDPDGFLPPAYGVDKLLESWLVEDPLPFSTSETHDLSLKSEFDLLLVRTPMEIVP